MTDKEINVRDEIVAAMEAANDPKDRAFLAIMMRFADHVERLFADDEMLRRKVLNGDYTNHSEDHELVESLRQKKVEAAIDWVNKRIVHNGYCKFANEAMQAEKETRATFKEHWKELVSSIVKDLPKMLFYGALLLAGYKVLG